MLTGLLLGILTVILWKSLWLEQLNILDEEYLCRIQQLEVHQQELLFHVLWIRFKPIIFLLLISTTRYLKIAVWQISLWYSFLCGFLCTISFIRYGLKGFLLLAIASFPQGIFYIIGSVYCWSWCLMKQRRKKEILYFMGFILLGCLIETTIQPLLFLPYIRAF